MFIKKKIDFKVFEVFSLFEVNLKISKTHSIHQYKHKNKINYQNHIHYYFLLLN